jgi:hypothetical protein
VTLVASFLPGNALAFTSTPKVSNGGTRGQHARQLAPRKRKAVVGDRPQVALPAGSDGFLDTIFQRPSLKKLLHFTDKNSFVLGIFLALFTAKFYPSIGMDGGLLRAEVSVGKYGVGLIFLLSGLSLQTSALAKAVSNMKLNGLIQLSTFAIWPFMVGVPLRAFLTTVMPNLIPAALADGLLILTCLPTTVNMCILLTSSVSLPLVDHRRY